MTRIIERTRPKSPAGVTLQPEVVRPSSDLDYLIVHALLVTPNHRNAGELTDEHRHSHELALFGRYFSNLASCTR